MIRLFLIGSEESFARRLATCFDETEGVLCKVFTGSAEELSSELSTLDGFETVVYAAADRGDGDMPRLSDARSVLSTCYAKGVSHLIVVASSEIYQPSHHHPGLATESGLANLRRSARGGRCQEWRAFEALVEEQAQLHSRTATTLLRPPPMPILGGRDGWSRLLERSAAVVPAGFDPTIQLMAVSDLAAAVMKVAESLAGTPSVRPASPVGSLGTSSTARSSDRSKSLRIFNLAPPAAIPVTKALRLAGTRRWPCPRWGLELFGSFLGSGNRGRSALGDALRYSWTVSGDRLRQDLGFEATVSSAQVALAMNRQKVERVDRLVTLSGPVPRAEVSKAALPPSAPEGRLSWKSRGEPPPSDWHLHFDDFGLDETYVARLEKRLFRFLHDRYWRIEVVGQEHIPRSGRALLVGIHRGLMPWDGVMALSEVRRVTARIPRFLIHPTLVKHPFLAPYMNKLGGLHACRENADHVLSTDGLLGIFPEGIRGAFSYYRRAYQLKRFGRDEYVRMALRNRAPIVPFVTVGSAEVFPILGKLHWKWWKRWSEWPCLPITPTFPFLPVPLPSKWHTKFLEPIHIEREYGPEAAEDPHIVSEIGDRVRELMGLEFEGMRSLRQSIFFGDIFGSRLDLEKDAKKQPSGEKNMSKKEGQD